MQNNGKGASSHHDHSTVIAAIPATVRQRKIAIGALIVLVVIVAATIPLVHLQFPRINSFVSILETGICIASLLTAAFLFVQYSVYPQSALLVLAGGFVFNGLFAFVTMPARSDPSVRNTRCNAPVRRMRPACRPRKSRPP